MIIIPHIEIPDLRRYPLPSYLHRNLLFQLPQLYCNLMALGGAVGSRRVLS